MLPFSQPRLTLGQVWALTALPIGEQRQAAHTGRTGRAWENGPPRHKLSSEFLTPSRVGFLT